MTSVFFIKGFFYTTLQCLTLMRQVELFCYNFVSNFAITFCVKITVSRNADNQSFSFTDRSYHAEFYSIDDSVLLIHCILLLKITLHHVFVMSIFILHHVFVIIIGLYCILSFYVSLEGQWTPMFKLLPILSKLLDHYVRTNFRSECFIHCNWWNNDY